MNTPNIRFKGFGGDWEQRKVGDMTVELSEYGNLQSGYPLLTSSRSGLMFQNDFRDKTSTDNLETLFSVVPYGKCTYRHMSDDNIFHFNINTITEKGLVSREYPVFDASENNNLSFLIQYLNSSPEFTRFCAERKLGGTRTRLYYKNLCEFKLHAPNKNEQDKIAEFFTNIDNLITLYQRKCDSLKQVKKYMLQKMFPKQGEKVPEIRFKGFSGDWEQKKFSEIAKTKRGLTYKPENIVSEGKRVLRSSNINEDTFEIHEDDVFVDENSVNIPYVKNGDILITSANGSNRLVGKHAIVRNIIDDSMVHGGFMLLASSDEPEFVNALMSSQWYTKFISVYVAGGNGAIGNLNKNDLDEQIVLVPSNNEMKKLGEYFRNIDNLITLYQRKVDSLKQVKKYMLQNMFP